MSILKTLYKIFGISQIDIDQIPIDEFEIVDFSISEEDFEDTEIYPEDQDEFNNCLKQEIELEMNNNTVIIYEDHKDNFNNYENLQDIE